MREPVTIESISVQIDSQPAVQAAVKRIPVPPANYLGSSGVTGDLSTTITMDDNVGLYGGTALFSEEFDPGSTISFLLTTTNNFAGTTPDAFATNASRVARQLSPR